MPKSKPLSLRELRRRRLLLESQCNRLVLTVEAQRLTDAMAWVDKGVEAGKQAAPILRAARAMWKSGRHPAFSERIAGLAALARALGAVWKLGRR